jgi:tetratricopeptide (TPR) repeat protein
LSAAACRISICPFALMLLLANVGSGRTLFHSTAAPAPRFSYPATPDDVALEAAQHKFDSGNYSAAIAGLQSVASQNPSNAAVFYWLGRCYYEVRDYDKAVANGEKSVALDPKNSVYQQWLGEEYGGKADRDQSYFVARKVKKQFELAVQLDPSNIAARRDLEEFCIEAPWIVGGNADEGKAQVDAIAAIDPIEGHLARAVFDIRSLKKPDLAEAEYRQVLNAKPGKPEPYFEAASFFQKQNKLDDMNAAIDAAAQVKPNDPRLAYYRAVAIISGGSGLSRAEEYLKSYIASTPDRSDWSSHADARDWLGRLYEAEGKTGQAAEQYRAALQLEPGRKETQARLAKLEKGSR